MGTWNTRILGNDGAMDVYGFFEKLYNQQELDIETIKQKTISNFGMLNERNEPVYENEEWLAYAYICWECKALDEQTIAVVREILSDQETIEEEWEELAGKRIEEIATFLNKIETPAKRKKAIKKQFIPTISYHEGDCVIFKDENGIWGGVIYLDIDKTKNEDPNMWHYYIVSTRIYSYTKPTLEDFVHSHFLMVNYGETIDGQKANWIKNPEIWISGRFIGDVKNEKEKAEIEEALQQYEIIGNLQFASKPIYKQSWSMSLKLYHNDHQFEWEKTHPDAIDLSYPVKNYLQPIIQNNNEPEPKKKSWKFW